jgi:hypothetical protein
MIHDRILLFHVFSQRAKFPFPVETLDTMQVVDCSIYNAKRRELNDRRQREIESR